MTTPSKPRTIDNLGLDASIRYARDKELYAPISVEEAQFVSRKTEISVAKPYVPSEFEELFSSAKTVIWALFSPPPESLTSGSNLFSYQLIPSLGSYEKQDDAEERLEDALKQRKRQSDKEKERDRREKNLISDLLANIENIDKSIELINSRRNQYQRG